MHITVRLFAILKDLAGTSEVQLDLLPAATVASAAERLGLAIPNLRDPLRRVAFAVNREYVSPGTELHDGDELAIIPPVSGG